MVESAQRQHFVSRGYQRNFADERRQLIVFNKHTGRHRLQGTRRTFVGLDFNVYRDRVGQPINALEMEWARIEAQILRRVREVSAGNVNSDVMRAAITSLLAVHLVRSREFERIHTEIYQSVAGDLVAQAEFDSEARRVFERERGRQAEPGELSELTRDVADQHQERREFLIFSMVRAYNRAVEIIAKSGLQILTIGDQTRAGFVITDNPVMHGERATGRLGFRDRLAIGDADFLAAPIGRRTAVMVTRQPLPAATIRNRRLVHAFNSVAWHAAQDEIACHPNDARDTARLRYNALSIAEAWSLLQ